MALVSRVSEEDGNVDITPFNTSSRRWTEEAVNRLYNLETTGNTQWYEPGTDFCFYASAHQTCLASRDRLLNILTPAELRELEATDGIDVVMSKMNEVAAELSKKSHKSIAERRTSDFINGFCDFAVKASGIVSTLLPQSPEYTVTFGIIVLIFQTVVKKKEREETLMDFIRSLVDRLPVVDFYKSIFPTYDMKLAVASIYVGLTKLLEDALIYFRGGRLSKLLDAVIRPKEGKFHQQIEDIDRAIERLNTLKTVANIAQQSDMKNMLQDAGHEVEALRSVDSSYAGLRDYADYDMAVIARIHQNVEGTTAALGQSMAFLNQKIDTIQARTDQILEFESFKYALSLRQIILASTSSEEADDNDMRVARSRNFSLTPKDSWDENGILEDLQDWSISGRRTLLWIGGSSGNHDPWITPFVLDMIEAFETQELTLLYALCNNTTDARLLTPNTLLRRLIAQVLSQHPKIAFQHPRLFNEYRFRNATSFDKLWKIFQQLTEHAKDVFLIIDRIEEVRRDEGGSVREKLIPGLIGLAANASPHEGEIGRVSVVVTSIHEAPEEIATDNGLTEVYIDTGKRPKKKS